MNMGTSKPKGTLSDNRPILWAVALLGFSSSVTQVIVLREMLNIFSGNELITGIVLSSWMLLTGTGAWIGRHSKADPLQLRFIISYILWLGISPLLTIIALYAAKYFLFPPGILIDIRIISPLTLLLLAPYCLTSGRLFAGFTTLAGQKQYYFRADRLYAIETIGSVAGGIIVSFVFIFWFSTIQSLSTILLISTLAAHSLKNKHGLINLLPATAAILLIINPFDIWLKKLIFPNLQVIKTLETPYGNITVTQSDRQFSIFENHSLLYSTQNPIEKEETVHYPMLQHPTPHNVILISSGNHGLISEILKYKTVRHLDYIEENRWLHSITQQFDTLSSSPYLSVVYSDARNFLHKVKPNLYDVAILDVPEPSTLQTNRYYTLEFFCLLKTRLNKNAVIGLCLPSSGNYYSAQNLNIQSLITNTLKQIFVYVLIIPGEKDYILASSRPLSANIASLTEIRGVPATYVNQYYIDDFSLGQQIKSINKALVCSNINRDFVPLAVYFSNNRYMSLFSAKTIILLLPLLVLLWPVIRLRPATLALYVSGFSVSALEVFLLLSFQIIFGFVYAASGIIISACMGGLAIGSITGWLWKWKVRRYYLSICQLLIGIATTLFINIISNIDISLNNNILYPLFIFSTLIPSIFAGFQFSQIIKSYPDYKFPGRFYAADLFGAALGAALVPLVFLPVLGIPYSMLIIIGLNTISAVFLLTSKE